MRKLAVGVPTTLAFLALLLVLSDGDDSSHAARERAALPARPPVVILVFDEFPLDDLLRPDGSIDAERYPSFAALARTSTWFPNAHTVYDSTFKAVPAILDAVLPRPGTAADLRSHPRSVYTLFARQGYDVVDTESGTAICPPRVCRRARTRRPGVLARLAGGGRPARLARWMGQIRPRRRPTLYLQHALLPHEPWIYLPDGNQSRPSGEDPVPGINRPVGFGDRRLTLHNEARHILQAGFVDHELGLMLARLRRTGLLYESLLVVTADHGYAFEVGAKDRRLVTESNVDEIAPVPLFVKAPGQRRGRVDPGFARNIDVVPTVASLLGLRLDWRHDGRSAFGPVSRRRRLVRIPTRDFSQVITIGARALERRRRANRLVRARLFGTGAHSMLLFGSPWAELYRAGPHAELIGRSLRSLRVGRADDLRARFHHPALVHAVHHSGPIVPVKLSGAIAGGRGRVELALAVNGRIAAVGRSFRLIDRRTENFSLLVPEGRYREGDNDVRLFAVRGRRLVPLGRA